MAQAPATVLQEINALYVALYGRAADGPGIAYWINYLSAHDPAITAQNAATMAISGPDATFLGQGFVNSQATYFNSLYSGLTDIQFVEALYKNIGGNAGDAGGIQFWVAQLTLAEGSSPSAAQIQAARAGIVGQFVNGILSIDLTNEAATGLSPADYNAAVARQNQLMNKVTVSQFYADQSNLPTVGPNILIVSANPSNSFTAAQDAVASVTNDNATVGVAKTAISASVASTSLQPIFNLVVPAFRTTFTLTVDQDNFTTGTGNDLYMAPINGIFGFQPTLTSFDTLIDNGNNNELDANFAGLVLGPISGLTIQGIQKWVFQNVGPTVTINGGALVGGAGPNGLPNNPGLQTLVVQNSTGGMIVGTAAAGINSVISNLNVSNNSGGFTSVFIAKGLFSGTNTLNVGVNVVGTTAAHYNIVAAPDTAGTTGYQTWNVVASDTVGDVIGLGAGTATNATTVNLSDAAGATAPITLFATTNGGSSDATNWANVTTVNGSGMTGALTVTGAESANGFLTSDAALTSISGGAGNDLFDLTGYTVAQLVAMTINGGAGANQVDIASAVATSATLTPLTGMTNEQTVGLAGALTGTLNDANFPGVTTFKMESASGGTGGSLSGNLAVTHAANNLTWNFQASALGGHTFTITDASTTSITDDLNLVLGGVSGGTANFTTNGFGVVNIAVTGGNALASAGVFMQNANPGGGDTLNISGTGSLGLGVTTGLTAATVGTDTVQLDSSGGPSSGLLNYTGSGTLTLGESNLVKLDAHTATGTVFMQAPVDSHGVTVLGSLDTATGVGDNLEGSILGVLTLDGAGPGYTAAIQNDSITSASTVGNVWVWGDGGQDMITLSTPTHTTADLVIFGEIGLNGNVAGSAGNPILEFSNNVGTYENPTTVSSSNSFASTVTNFQPTHDIVDLRVAAWGYTGGAGNYGGLAFGDGTHLTAAGPVVVENINSAGATIFNGTTLVADGIATYADGAHLLSALNSINGMLFQTTHANGYVDELFAYSDGANTHIAEVRFASGASSTTAGNTLAVHDLVVLTGVSLASVTAADVHFV